MNARLKSQFDRWIERARQPDEADPLDRSLGALLGLDFWFFLNSGQRDDPQPAAVELDGTTLLLVFSDLDHLDDFTLESGRRQAGQPLSFFCVPTLQAPPYCMRFEKVGVRGILVNPGAFAFSVELPTLESFYRAWRDDPRRQERAAFAEVPSSFEEDFWVENDGAILEGDRILRPGSSGFERWMEQLQKRGQSADRDA